MVTEIYSRFKSASEAHPENFHVRALSNRALRNAELVLITFGSIAAENDEIPIMWLESEKRIDDRTQKGFSTDERFSVVPPKTKIMPE